MSRIPPTNYDAINFLIQQALARVETCTIAKVMACTNTGGIAPAGFVDVQPMINQTNGDGTMTPHGTVHRLPYSRLQGGKNAFIIDPQPGDIGVVVFASRDTNSVKNTRGQANPGSRRRHDMADGIYVGSILNGAPEQYIGYSDSGIAITSPTKITISAPEVAINGQLTVTGEVTAGFGTGDQVTLQDHTHSGNGAPPTPES